MVLYCIPCPFGPISLRPGGSRCQCRDYRTDPDHVGQGERVAETGGSDRGHILSTTIYIKDIALFAQMNERGVPRPVPVSKPAWPGKNWMHISAFDVFLCFPCIYKKNAYLFHIFLDKKQILILLKTNATPTKDLDNPFAIIPEVPV